MRYAPDKDDPLPKPPKNGNGNGGGKAVGFMPGEIRGLAEDMVASAGGSVDKWKKYLDDVYSPSKPANYLYGGGNGGKGGGKGTGTPNDPNNPSGDDQGNGGFEPSSPRNRMGPKHAGMPYGVMAGLQSGNGVMSGIPMMSTPAPQIMNPQMAMPTSGVLAMLRARRT